MQRRHPARSALLALLACLYLTAGFEAGFAAPSPGPAPATGSAPEPGAGATEPQKQKKGKKKAPQKKKPQKQKPQKKPKKAPQKKGGKGGPKKGGGKAKSKPLKPHKPLEPRPPLYPQPEGTPGTLFPLANDARSAEAPLHSEAFGPAEREIAALEARPGQGFHVLWSDGRDGLPGFYAAALDGSGKAQHPEQPLRGAPSGASAEQAALDFGAAGGFAAWIEDGKVRLRALHPSGEPIGSERTLGSATFAKLEPGQAAAGAPRASNPKGGAGKDAPSKAGASKAGAGKPGAGKPGAGKGAPSKPAPGKGGAAGQPRSSKADSEASLPVAFTGAPSQAGRAGAGKPGAGSGGKATATKPGQGKTKPGKTGAGAKGSKPAAGQAGKAGQGGAAGPAAGRAPKKGGPKAQAHPPAKPRPLDASRPSVAVLDRGGALVAWQAEGRIAWQRVDAKGKPLGNPETSPSGGEITAGPFACASSSGMALVVWSADGHVRWALSAAPGKRRFGTCGDGIVRAAATERSGGVPSAVWLAIEVEGAAHLRRLSPLGKQLGNESVVAATPGAPLALASSDLGPVVLYARAEQAHEGTAPSAGVELALFDPRGRPRAEPVRLAWGRWQLGGARLAVEGERVLVAWSQDGRVQARALALGDARPLETVQRIDERAASTDQRDAVVVAGLGEPARAVAAWVDGRLGPMRPVVRVLREAQIADEPLSAGAGPEIALPARAGTAELERAGTAFEARHPAVAVGEGGEFLVAWLERPLGEGALPEPAWQLRAQLFSAAGVARGSAWDLGGGEPVRAGAPPALAALRAQRGWAAAWVREGYGLVAQHVAHDGTSPSLPTLIAGPAAAPRGGTVPIEVDRPALGLLDDNRLVLVWDQDGPTPERRVRGRFLQADLRAEGMAFDVDLAPRGHDWDASVAAGPDSGFVLAWVTGEPSEETDVFLRFFGRDGRPAAPPLAVTTLAGAQAAPTIVRRPDRTWAIAWQDDLSAVDAALMRRLASDRVTLGPVVTLHTLETAFNPARVAPSIAPLGEQVVALWSDASRASGLDVVARAFGNDFDRGLPPLVSAPAAAAEPADDSGPAVPQAAPAPESPPAELGPLR